MTFHSFNHKSDTLPLSYPNSPYKLHVIYITALFEEETGMFVTYITMIVRMGSVDLLLSYMPALFCQDGICVT